MGWEPGGYVEIPDDEDEDATWHGSRACGFIRHQKRVTGPIGYLERHEATGDERWVENCKCAGEVGATFATESGKSIRHRLPWPPDARQGRRCHRKSSPASLSRVPGAGLSRICVSCHAALADDAHAVECVSRDVGRRRQDAPGGRPDSGMVERPALTAAAWSGGRTNK